MLQPERKFNPSQLIGFILLGALFIGYLYYNGQKQQEREKLEERLEAEGINIEDSLALPDTLKNKAGIEFKIPEKKDTLKPAAFAQKIHSENKNLSIEFVNQGAQIKRLGLKEYQKYNKKTKTHSDSLFLMDNNSNFNVKLQSTSGKVYNTQDLMFDMARKKSDSTEVVTFTTPLENGVLAFIYTISPDYKVDLQLQSQGINFSEKPKFEFFQKSYQLEKGRNQEQYYTDLHYAYDSYEETSYETKHLEEDEETINWFCIKQQFFLTILEAQNGFNNSKAQVSIVEMPNGMENPHLKNFDISAHFGNKDGNLNETISWYFLPMNMDLLSSEPYKSKSFDDLIPFDYFNSGIIGWLNKHFFYNIYRIMHNWGLASGWIIMLMTIVVKLLMSPIMYKQHKSSAMMRAIKPDMEKISEKYKDDPLKKQQETMALQRKAGVNMFSGCIPALLQIPLFMALFRLFPNIIQMRGESFLWANDLTAYDSIYEWSTYIPGLSDLYGNHISLFTILYAVMLILYTRMNSSNIQQPTQEGMPDMRKIMYIMPLFFVFFLNSYASGLTWYYVVSNAINILVILFIKQFMIDEDKIHAMVQENVKKAPKKQKKSRFQQLLDQAAEQQKLQEQQKKKKKK